MKNLLILDDDQQVALTIKEVAQSIGFEVTVSNNAADFFRYLESSQVTHIALDLVMPGTDGVSVIRELSKRESSASLLIISGLGERVVQSARKTAVEHGLHVAGVLTKPFRISALKQLLLLQRPQRHADLQSKVIENNFPATDGEISEEELLEALNDKRLTVYYQPKINCETGRLAGFEALARLVTVDNKIVMPLRFIALAERGGQINQLTEMVFSQSLEWFSDNFHDSDITIALNASSRFLSDPAVPVWLTTLCEHYDVPNHRVILELTETSMVEKPEVALNVMTELRVKGFNLAIDDFGVGYSSLVNLARYPFSELKIDRDFVLSIDTNTESKKIARLLCALADALELSSTAEGVESAEALAFLAEVGCRNAQGYFIARPLPGDEARNFQGIDIASISEAGP